MYHPSLIAEYTIAEDVSIRKINQCFPFSVELEVAGCTNDEEIQARFKNLEKLECPSLRVCPRVSSSMSRVLTGH